MEWIDLPVDEFTIDGSYLPADPIRWPADCHPNEIFGLTGWRFVDTLGTRAEPTPSAISAHVFAEDATGQVLIDLLALGVRAGILCRSRIAFVVFLHQWLRKLTRINESDRIRNLERTIAQLDSTLHTLVRDWLRAPGTGDAIERSSINARHP
jgi:hypothetical protein